MNFRQPPAPRRGLHRCFRVLTFLLLQHAFAPANIDAYARSRLPSSPAGSPGTDGSSRPYLKVADLRPLRFKPDRPPPDLSSRPSAGAPPQPLVASGPDHRDSVETNLEPGHNPGDTTPLPPPAAPPVAVPTGSSPIAILPDDTRPSTRHEDFLPFFQLPGTNPDVNIFVPGIPTRPPAPGPLPPSSATYQQK